MLFWEKNNFSLNRIKKCGEIYLLYRLKSTKWYHMTNFQDNVLLAKSKTALNVSLMFRPFHSMDSYQKSCIVRYVSITWETNFCLCRRRRSRRSRRRSRIVNVEASPLRLSRTRRFINVVTSCRRYCRGVSVTAEADAAFLIKRLHPLGCQGSLHCVRI